MLSNCTYLTIPLCHKGCSYFSWYFRAILKNLVLLSTKESDFLEAKLCWTKGIIFHEHRSISSPGIKPIPAGTSPPGRPAAWKMRLNGDREGTACDRDVLSWKRPNWWPTCFSDLRASSILTFIFTAKDVDTKIKTEGFGNSLKGQHFL